MGPLYVGCLKFCTSSFPEFPPLQKLTWNPKWMFGRWCFFLMVVFTFHVHSPGCKPKLGNIMHLNAPDILTAAKFCFQNTLLQSESWRKKCNIEFLVYRYASQILRRVIWTWPTQQTLPTWCLPQRPQRNFHWVFVPQIYRLCLKSDFIPGSCNTY